MTSKRDTIAEQRWLKNKIKQFFIDEKREPNVERIALNNEHAFFLWKFIERATQLVTLRSRTIQKL